MARPKSPFSVLLTMVLVGALVGILGRFVYSAYVITQAGESLRWTPPGPLLIDVMEIHWFALYGAGVGAVLGVVFILADFLRSGEAGYGRASSSKEEISPFAEDKVKAQRMALGERYLDEANQEDGGDGTS